MYLYATKNKEMITNRKLNRMKRVGEGKCRYWLVRVREGVSWIVLLPLSAEVWREIKSGFYVVRYLNPVTERALRKLPLESYRVWPEDGHELGDKERFVKVKCMDDKYWMFFNHFKA